MLSDALALLLALAAGAADVGGTADAPSFSCSPPASYARKLVCADPDLSRQDRELAAHWRLELAHDPTGRAHQLGPLVLHELDTCRTQACVTAWYRQRQQDTLLGVRR